MSRRGFLKASALFGAGALVHDVILPETVSAQQAATKAAQPAPMPPFAPAYGPGSAKGSVAEVYQKARQALYPICRVCRRAMALPARENSPDWADWVLACRSRTTIVACSTFI